MALWVWLTIGVLALVRIVQVCISKGKNKNKMLPPGPRGFPIFGSLHLLGKFPTMDLHQLAQKYGDIMYLRLGLQHTVVVSSAQAAELFLKTHDLNFASRPPNTRLGFAEVGACGKFWMKAEIKSNGEDGVDFDEPNEGWRLRFCLGKGKAEKLLERSEKDERELKGAKVLSLEIES